ncbi:MAG: GNAT family N-acetyltransferase [Clostridia bacterium]|nr:GNAT family N-acetyltransferase [Clostridia bacterium]
MIRRAEEKDAPRISALLKQVLEVHAAVRPDMYRSGTQKYSEADVLKLLADPDCVLFVETDETDRTVGYAICFVHEIRDDGIIVGRRELYIDDLCVDECERKSGVGKRLFERVKAYAKENGFDWITLNVWNDNVNALAFYRKMGLTERKTILEYRID